MIGTLTKREMADVAHVHVNTLDNWASKGYGPPRMKVGRRVLYRMEDVEAWMKEQAPVNGKAPTVLADDEGRKQGLGGSTAASEHTEVELWLEKWLAVAPPMSLEQQAQIVRILRGAK